MTKWLVLFVVFAFVSCKTKTIYVPVDTVRTEYINKIWRDSIHRYDSIYLKEKGDSVILEKYKFIYRDRLKIDTIIKIDSVSIPFPVVEVQEVNRLSSFQSFQVWCGRILLLVLIAYFGMRFLFRKLL